jgi:ABC-type uncharacterized transport system permease subunit
MGPFDATLLAAALSLTTPILLAAVGELISERAGVLNVGLEGMMLMGAFFAFLVAYYSHSVLVAVCAGLVAGMALAAIMAALALEARADQIVVGVGLNILALGVTAFAFEEIFAGKGQVVVDRMGVLEIPLLSDIPEVGPALFAQRPLVYVAFLAVPAAWYLFYRTNWGLMIRATGELPEATDTSGGSVRIVRWAAILTAGAAAGLAGAYLSVGQTGLFTDGMSGGRGFLALAAVIFAKWRPLGVLGASALFGAADAFQLRLQASEQVPVEVWAAAALFAGAYLVYRFAWRRALPGASALVVAFLTLAGALVLVALEPAVDLPSQLWLSVPYICALLALAGFVGRARMPSALAVSYHRGDPDA